MGVSKLKHLIIVLLISSFFIIACSNELSKIQVNQINDSIIDNSKLENLSAEEILDTYTSYYNYNSFSDRIKKVEYRKQLSMDFALNSLEDEKYRLIQSQFIISDLFNECNEAKKIFNKDICGGNIMDDFIKLENSRRVFEVTSKEEIFRTADTVKFKVNFKDFYDDNFGKDEFKKEIVFILKKEGNIWKVNDFINESGDLLSEKVDLEKLRQEDEKSIQELKVIGKLLRTAIEENQNLRQVEKDTQGISIVSNSFDDFDILCDQYATNLQKHDLFDKQFKNKYVKWTGEVRSISESFGKFSLQIRHCPYTFVSDVKIMVNGDQRDKLLSYREGDLITYRAKVYRLGDILGVFATDGIIVN